MQFGAAGSHSDVPVHVRVSGGIRINPISQSYVAEAKSVLFPNIPAVRLIIVFSGMDRIPQSDKNLIFVMQDVNNYNI